MLQQNFRKKFKPNIAKTCIICSLGLTYLENLGWWCNCEIVLSTPITFNKVQSGFYICSPPLTTEFSYLFDTQNVLIEALNSTHTV